MGFNSPLIIRSLKPLIDDLFTTHFAYYHFYEIILPSLENEKPFIVRHKFSWKVFTLSHLNPHIIQCENEVRRIVQQLTNQLQDAFTDVVKLTKHTFQLPMHQLGWLFLLNNQVRKQPMSYLLYVKNAIEHLVPKTTPLKRRMKDQDLVENNTWVINVPKLLELPVPKKLMVPKETITTEEVRKHKNEKKSLQIMLI